MTEIYYQINYTGNYFEPAYYNDMHKQLFSFLENKYHNLSIMNYNDFLNYYPLKRPCLFRDKFYEIVHCYGSGGRYMIIRYVNEFEIIIKNLKNNIFSNYKNDESYVNERNYRLINAFKLNTKNLNSKINKSVKLILNINET